MMITSPTDERLTTNQGLAPQVDVKRVSVHVKAWSDKKLLRGYAEIGDQRVDLEQIGKSALWQATLQTDRIPDGISQLTAHFEDEDGKSAQDTIRLVYQSLIGTVETSNSNPR